MIQMAAELIGAVSASPTSVATVIPIGNGWSVVAALITSPSQVINFERYGPTNMPHNPPVTMVTIGVSTMSSLVLPAISEPSSLPTTAAANAPTGPPRL